MTDVLVTVIIPCHNERGSIGRTLESILKQRSADGRPIDEWGEILVVNDASTDGTGEVLAEIASCHPCIEVLLNNPQLGLSGSYNRAIRLAQAPLLLTCHADCQLEGAEYLRTMLAHFRDETVAAVVGKPKVVPELTFVEKAYLLTHMMDVAEEPSLVREINFPEGRCDGFRKQALLEIGLYDELTRTAGEDQVIASALRHRGYRILQDTSLRYRLSCGSSQNTLLRVIGRQAVLARGQAFALCRIGFDTSRQAVTTPNRLRRKHLRLGQTIVVPVFFLAVGLLCLLSWWRALVVGLIGVVVARFFLLLIQNEGLLPVWELTRMLPIAIACDFSYAFGLYQGLWRYLRKRSV